MKCSATASLRGASRRGRVGSIIIMSTHKTVKMIIQKQPAVYIMTNQRNGTIYNGVTSNLVKRVYEHRNGLINGFTKKYSCKILVFFEIHETMESAIVREKQIKLYTRKKKLQLIETMNSQWLDLYSGIV